MSNNDLEDLKDLRDTIEQLDKRLIALIGVRLGLAFDFAKVKEKHNMKIHDPEREAILHRLYAQWAKQYEVEPDMVRDIFTAIMGASKKRQENLIAASPIG